MEEPDAVWSGLVWFEEGIAVEAAGRKSPHLGAGTMVD